MGPKKKSARPHKSALQCKHQVQRLGRGVHRVPQQGTTGPRHPLDIASCIRLRILTITSQNITSIPVAAKALKQGRRALAILVLRLLNSKSEALGGATAPVGMPARPGSKNPPCPRQIIEDASCLRRCTCQRQYICAAALYP